MSYRSLNHLLHQHEFSFCPFGLTNICHRCQHYHLVAFGSEPQRPMIMVLSILSDSQDKSCAKLQHFTFPYYYGYLNEAKTPGYYTSINIVDNSIGWTNVISHLLSPVYHDWMMSLNCCPWSFIT